MNLIQKTRQFMLNEGIDYLLVNSTNEFLVEYSELCENSRYILTNFSGSVGDALLSLDKLFLFVDGRYHQQADLEANADVTVVKMKLGQSFSESLCKKMKKNKILAIASKKNSQGRYEVLSGVLKTKNITIKLLDIDLIIDFSTQKKPFVTSQVERIDESIAGVLAEDKLNIVSSGLKKNQAILSVNLEEVSYLCNLRDFSKNYSSKIEAKCLIMKDFAVLFSDEPIKEFSKKFKVLRLNKFEDYVRNLSNIEKFFVDKLTINAYDYALLKDKVGFLKENILKEMKSVKNSSEIAHYKTCFERTDKALNATREFILNNNNISEFDIAKILKKNFYKFGAKSLSFTCIVAKGENSALAHYTKNSTDEILTDDDFVLIDCGAYYEGGYATDITRVFAKGEPSKILKKVYTIVLKGFLASFNKKSKNISGYSLDKAARKVLDKFAQEDLPKGFAFSHALGHGIGINVHEAPPILGLSPAAKTPLKVNMCFTIEPGLYKKGFGGVRLENSCYLSEEKGELKIKSFSNMCFEEKLIDFELLTEREKKWLKDFNVQ